MNFQELPSQKFRRTDLFRAAMQQRGATPTEINLFLAYLERAAIPGEFKKWNRELDKNELKLLVLMLTPAGEPLIDELVKAMMHRFNISREDIKKHFRSIELN